MSSLLWSCLVPVVFPVVFPVVVLVVVVVFGSVVGPRCGPWNALSLLQSLCLVLGVISVVVPVAVLVVVVFCLVLLWAFLKSLNCVILVAVLVSDSCCGPCCMCGLMLLGYVAGLI